MTQKIVKSRPVLKFLLIVSFLCVAILVLHSHRSKKTTLTFDNNKTINSVSGNVDYSLNWGGIERRYKVHIPKNYNRLSASPVVIYLHGGGGSMDGAYNDKIDTYSDSYDFILLVPEGTGPRLPRKILGSWNSGEWYVDGKQQGCCGYAYENNVDDIGFITAMLNKTVADYAIDESRIYATGISNGAMMSYALACNLSERIAAIASVASPATPDECVPRRSVPIMHIHGTADPCVPYNGGLGEACISSEKRVMQSAQHMVDEWVKINESDTSYMTSYTNNGASCVTYDGRTRRGADVEFCTIAGMGHAYPSGNQYMPIDKIGPVSYDLSFDQIWQFFKKHTLQ